ncbi:MAG TPA: hypothetical protein VIO35_04825, partial [Chloroflexota bacterium]
MIIDKKPINPWSRRTTTLRDQMGHILLLYCPGRNSRNRAGFLEAIQQAGMLLDHFLCPDLLSLQ